MNCTTVNQHQLAEHLEAAATAYDRLAADTANLEGGLIAQHWTDAAAEARAYSSAFRSARMIGDWTGGNLEIFGS